MALLLKIIWLGHASLLIQGSLVIYIDPWKIPAGSPEADIILITHGHYDHLSKNDIKAVSGPGTVVIGPSRLTGEFGGKGMIPGDTMTIKNCVIEAVPSYNIDKKFHPKSDNNLGFVITIDNKKIYIAGDTDFIPEMKRLTDIDVAFLPAGGTYTMDWKEAAAAADSFKPVIAVPVHWGEIVGSKKDAEKFAENYPGGRILKPGEALTLP